MKSASWPRRLPVVAILGPLLWLCGCIQPGQQTDFGAGSASAAATRLRTGPGLRMRWARELSPPDTGSYIPVEPAAPAFDAVGNQVYVGSARGMLFGFDAGYGRKVVQYNAKSAISTQPTVDSVHSDELYVPTVSGALLALRRTPDGLAVRYQVETGGAISQPAVLSTDACYVVTDEETVIAFARADGSILWRYHRDPHEGFGITGHAGLTLTTDRLLTGFGDGTIVSLNPGDGHLQWELDTSLDLEELDATRRFTDVDTTPIVVGDAVYAASFSGGLYVIDAAAGTVRQRIAELKAMTGITATQDALVLTSAEEGVICLDLPRLTLRFRRRTPRGSPGRAQILGDRVYIAESRGAFVALSLANGREEGRLETAHGVTAPAALGDTVGFVFSNGGTLYAFAH